jgi:predicted metal-dependent HD superfamily phosphohydrolase
MMAEVRDAYCAVGASGVRRHYHDAQHVGGIWATWLALGGSPYDKGILYAAAYHDLVYEPGAPKGTNERDSALAFAKQADALGIDRDIGCEVLDIIGATADHLACPFTRGIIFCDLDLAGFACDRDEYDDNTDRLRREFAHVGQPQWQAGRVAFLQGLLNAPRIFRSPIVPDWWEDKARANIRMDLAT